MREFLSRAMATTMLRTATAVVGAGREVDETKEKGGFKASAVGSWAVATTVKTEMGWRY